MKRYGRHLVSGILLSVLVLTIGVVAYLSGSAGILAGNRSVRVVGAVPTYAVPELPPRTDYAPLEAQQFGIDTGFAVDIALIVTLLPGVQQPDAYLPGTGNTQFVFIPPTDFPTPLPYPTTPPLPLPTLTPFLLPTIEGGVAALPYVADNCAPQGYPVEGLLTQRFHAYHGGIDIGVPLGTPVLATHSGTIVIAGWSDVGYGNLVVVQNGAFITYYAHNTSLNVVGGQQVGRGTILAFSGSTGNSSGPHVHYETRVLDVPVDPLTFTERGFATC
jgi:murein DD-endopeptidase MepM/ murein hydrolase activator NlpD